MPASYDRRAAPARPLHVTSPGEAVHKGQSHPGEHKAIISQDLWDKVHAIFQESPRKRAAKTRAQTPALLKGLIFGPTRRAMTPAHTRGSQPSSMTSTRSTPRLSPGGLDPWFGKPACRTCGTSQGRCRSHV